MSKLLKLKKEFSDVLVNTPESGMGYHIVDVTTIKGNVLKDRTVMNGQFLKIGDNERLDNNKILKIEVKNERINEK